MENKEADEKDGGGCCSKGKCCGGKALGAVALLALGALGGYLASRHCAVPRDAAPAIQSPAK